MKNTLKIILISALPLTGCRNGCLRGDHGQAKNQESRKQKITVDGELIYTAQYTPFGRVITENGDGLDAKPEPENTFTGQQKDRDLDMQDYGGNRY